MRVSRTTRCLGIAVGVALAATVGCSSGAGSDQAAPEPAAALAQDDGDEDGDGAEDGEDGAFRAEYQRPERENRDAARMMRESTLLEDLTAVSNDLLVLPHDVPVIGENCGLENAFWSPEDGAIHICYELVDLLQELLGAVDPEGQEQVPPESVRMSALGALSGVYFHELGHGLISIYELPTTGREEDAVDQLAAVLLISAGEDGEEYLVDMAYVHALLAAEEAEEMPSARRYADEHSLGAQRFFNLVCLLYGSDPEKYQEMAGEDGLPEERAEQCPGEYLQASSAWLELLEPHLEEGVAEDWAADLEERAAKIESWMEEQERQQDEDDEDGQDDGDDGEDDEDGGGYGDG